MVSSKVAGARAVVGRPRGRSELERQVLKRAPALLECEEAVCLTAGEGQAGFARCPAILFLERVVSLRAAAAVAAGQCERSLLLIRSGWPSGGIRIGNLARKTGCCHLLSAFSPKKSAFFCSRRILGQKIVSAASSDPAPNEFTDGRRFGQDNARIDIRGVTFAPGDMRLIDQ